MGENESGKKVPAGALAPWDVGELPPPPMMQGWRTWVALIGPGVVLAGTSIGSGEWLFGPAVSAQYGATLLWLALISIVLQSLLNLTVMRYALYCGEPIIVGAVRTSPAFWITLFAILDVAAVWPYNASNAAVPLAALILGHLPVEADRFLVKGLGFTVFLLAFVPLIFGGTVYRMLEKVMAAKLVLVLGYLTLVAVTMVSVSVAWNVTKGFFCFGMLPVRPTTLIVGRHFNMTFEEQGRQYYAKGTYERTKDKDVEKVTGDIIENPGRHQKKYSLAGELRKTLRPEVLKTLSNEELDTLERIRQRALERTRPYKDTNKFRLEASDRDVSYFVDGVVIDYHDWQADHIKVAQGASEKEYDSLNEVPEPHQAKVSNYLKHEGQALVDAWSYVRENGRLPSLDYATIVAFIAIAGAGGFTNTLFSNYARDKGWGMGKHVGAIPSALGARTIGLSHTGRVFELTSDSLKRWGGWLRHIGRDQAIWVFASVIGMALPCMISLEFIRNSSVVGDRVAAMTAEGIAERYPTVGPAFWFLTLFCGFLVLAPGQVSSGDQFARRWTDIIWTTSSRLRGMGRGEVRYVYYGMLGVYLVFGSIIIAFLSALQTATIAAVLQNLALGISAFMTLYVNHRLLPRELRNAWPMQIGLLICGTFFFAISTAMLFFML